MSERKIGFDRATLGDKIAQETDCYLVMPAVIAKELVQPYRQGMAFKPAEELEKAAWTAEGRWVTTMKHPDTGLITRRSKHTNPRRLIPQTRSEKTIQIRKINNTHKHA